MVFTNSPSSIRPPLIQPFRFRKRICLSDMSSHFIIKYHKLILNAQYKTIDFLWKFTISLFLISPNCHVACFVFQTAPSAKIAQQTVIKKEIDTRLPCLSCPMPPNSLLVEVGKKEHIFPVREVEVSSRVGSHGWFIISPELRGGTFFQLQ